MTLVVTGAAGGIGGAVVALAAERGIEVIAHDRDTYNIAALPGVRAIGGDLLDPAGRAALARAAAGARVTGVVAAHGIPGDGALRALDADRVRRIMDINFRTIPELYADLRDALAATGGAFVAVASQASLRAERDNAAYCASKWAVTGWVTAIAGPARAEHGIHVRALCPGRTESPLLETAMAGFAAAVGEAPEAYTKRILDAIPTHRFATARETASAALHLAAAASGRPTILATSGGEVPF